MKVVGVILAMIIVAFAVNILMGGGEVTKAALAEEEKKQYAEMQTVIQKSK